MDPLAEQVVQTYENNVRIITALGKEFGFQSFFFFQPFLPTVKKPLTSLERQIAAERIKQRPWEIKFFDKVYERIRQSSYLSTYSRFRNLENTFAEDRRPIFLDSEHLFPEGNEAIVDAMVPLIRGNALIDGAF